MAEQGKEGMLPKNIRQIGQISGNQKIYHVPEADLNSG